MLFLNKKHLNLLLVGLFFSSSYAKDDKPADSLSVKQEQSQGKKEEKSLKISDNFFRAICFDIIFMNKIFFRLLIF